MTSSNAVLTCLFGWPGNTRVNQYCYELLEITMKFLKTHNQSTQLSAFRQKLNTDRWWLKAYPFQTFLSFDCWIYLGIYVAHYWPLISIWKTLPRKSAFKLWSKYCESLYIFRSKTAFTEILNIAREKGAIIKKTMRRNICDCLQKNSKIPFWYPRHKN